VFTSPARVRHNSGLDCASEAYQLAAGKHADIATLAAAHELGMKYTNITMAGASNCNKLAEVQYLHSQGCPWPPRPLDDATRRGYFDLVRWCHEQGCPFWDNRSAARNAAESGDVAQMAWVLQQPGTRLCERAMKAAAMEGHTAMCHYLHEQQCPWGSSSVRTAAFQGHAELLSWMMDNGYTPNEHFLRKNAAQGGSIEVLALLQQRKLLTSAAELRGTLGLAGRYNQLAAAQWLREQGAEWPAVLWRWRHGVLAWARAEGCTSPMVTA
jgi:hypothetical protein